jgi:flagellar biosynthesis protein FliP
MNVTADIFPLLTAILLCTSFIKVVTTLTVVRFGIGLTGFEFGVVSILTAFGLAVLAAPPELARLGYPAAFFASTPAAPSAQQVTAALLPYMAQRLDPAVQRAFAGRTVATAPFTAPVGVSPAVTDVEGGAEVSAAAQGVVDLAYAQQLRTVAPVFLISELKRALLFGCAVLVPFVVIDLLVAHVVTLLGVTTLSAAVVSLPLKLLLFLAVDGWTLLATKLLG